MLVLLLLRRRTPPHLPATQTPWPTRLRARIKDPVVYTYSTTCIIQHSAYFFSFRLAGLLTMAASTLRFSGSGPNDPRFIRMNSDVIRRNLTLFDNDVNVKTVYQITMNSLLSGNIQFNHTSASNRFHKNPEDLDWLSRAYGDLSRDVVRYLWAIGFCPVTFIPHPRYIGKPVVLNLDRCEVYFYRDVFGQCHFRFYERIEVGSSTVDVVSMFLPLGPQFMEIDMNRREIPNVSVFVMDPPSNDGTLCSRISLLATDLFFESHLATCCVEADRHRCNPPLITSVERKTPDSKALTITDRLDVRGVHSTMYGDGTQEGRIRETQIQDAMADAAHMHHVAAYMDASMEGGHAHSTKRALERKFLQSNPLREYYLETDRQYVKHTLPEAPHAEYMQFRIARKEDVFAMFCIPLAMISQQSALAGRSSMNENAYIVFLDAQKYLKHVLLNVIRVIYRQIYDAVHMEDYVLSTLKKKEFPTLKGVEEAQSVEVTMPGMPPETTMERLFVMGLLTTEAYIEYLNTKHGIPLECFNKEPKLSLQEINQLPPPEEGSGRSSSASKK